MCQWQVRPTSAGPAQRVYDSDYQNANKVSEFWVKFGLQCWFAQRISKISARSLTNVDRALSANSASSAPPPPLCKIYAMDQKFHCRVKLAFCDPPNVAGGGRWPWLSGCGIGIWSAIKFRISPSRTKQVLKNIRCVRTNLQDSANGVPCGMPIYVAEPQQAQQS